MAWDSPITSPAQLEAAVLELGFLPFFKNSIPGFSIAERTPPEYWFVKDREGPWEWKGPVLRGGKCAYGKFFHGKAVYVALDWLPDLVHYRRDGYDCDARCDEGLCSWHEKRVYETLAAAGSMRSRDLKEDCGYGSDGMRGFDQVVTRLQMLTYLCIEDFEYELDRHGRPYGWGVARYTTPEALYGRRIVRSAYRRAPEESLARIVAHLAGVLPADEKKIARLVKF